MFRSFSMFKTNGFLLHRHSVPVAQEKENAKQHSRVGLRSPSERWPPGAGHARVCIRSIGRRSRNPERCEVAIISPGERSKGMSLSCSRQVRDAVYLTGELTAMRVSKLATWFMACAMFLAGASIVWHEDANAADTAKSVKAAEPVVGNPANDTCLGCHGNEGFAMPGADGQVRQLHVIKDKFGKSVHGKRACVECHT